MTNFKEDLLRFNQIWLDHPSTEKFYYQMGERLVPDIFIDENYELNYREINYAEKIRSLNYTPGAMREFFTWRGWEINTSLLHLPRIVRVPTLDAQNYWVTIPYRKGKKADHYTYQMTYSGTLSDDNEFSQVGRSHGWLFPYLIGTAELLDLEHRSNRWFAPIGDLIVPGVGFINYEIEIKKYRDYLAIAFEDYKSPSIQDSLNKILEEVIEPRLKYDGTAEVRLRAVEFLINWFLWSLGHPAYEHFPEQTEYCNPLHFPAVWARLYDIFFEKRLFHLMMINSYDYLGELLRPCLHLICPHEPDSVLMDFEIIESHIKDYFPGGTNTINPFVDAEIYTGRYLMVAGGYTHNLMGSTAYPTLGKVAWINCLMYCPDAIFTIPTLFTTPEDISTQQIFDVVRSKNINPDSYLRNYDLSPDRRLLPFGIMEANWLADEWLQLNEVSIELQLEPDPIEILIEIEIPCLPPATELSLPPVLEIEPCLELPPSIQLELAPEPLVQITLAEPSHCLELAPSIQLELAPASVEVEISFPLEPVFEEQKILTVSTEPLQQLQLAPKEYEQHRLD